jgi:uncharacterized protein (DUF2147 family)
LEDIMKATKPEFRIVLQGARCPAALTRQLNRGGGGPLGSTSLPLTAAKDHVKKLSFILALGLTSAAAQAGTLFEIPINGGIARFQLDDNCHESICATLSWNENRGPSSSAAGTSGAAAVPAAPAGEPPAAVARLAPQEPPSAPSDAKAPGPAGEWLVEDGDARIRITECGRNLCGVISAAKNANDTDRKNANPELRNRPIIGLPILLDMKPVGKRWEGRIYNAKDGQTYDAHISPIDPQKLRVEGCVFGGLICGGQNWTRVN